MLSATVYYNVAKHPEFASVFNHCKLLSHLHCVIKPFVYCENLLNPVGMQCAQWIHEQTSEGVAARQPCGGFL